MSPNDAGRSDHDELILSYLDKAATPEEEEQFRILLGEESFCRRVAEYAIDSGHLYDYARQGMLGSEPTARRRPDGQRRWLAVVVASVLLALSAFWWPRGAGTSHESADRATSLGDVTGQVFALSPGSENRRPVVAGAQLQSGDRLHVVGAESFALLKFDDGSRIAVAGDTQLTCRVTDSRKYLTVHNGDIMAQVTPQTGEPMLIDTPTAEAEVVGTRLSVFAGLALTELAVQQGHVRLTRLSDNHTIDVLEGQCAVASETSELVAQAITPIRSVWDEDFERQWPNRWRAGYWIHHGLPAGSTGAAVAKSREKEDGPCFISTPNEWFRGLFRIEEDTHLNLAYKLRTQVWFYVMLGTRSEHSEDVYRGTYMYQTPDLWKIPENRWRTVSIPLRDFHEPQRSRPKGATLAAPNLNDVVFSLLLRTGEPDPKLTVDRIWVTIGPAEGAELLKLP